jgi:hypothetical protein
VVVIVVGVVVLLNDSPLALLPHPAAKTSTAALPHNVIAVLPLCFVMLVGRFMLLMVRTSPIRLSDPEVPTNLARLSVKGA